MTKQKVINYTNGITYFLTSSEKSYTELADDITYFMKKLGCQEEMSISRVKDFARKNIPFGIELDAICLAKFTKSKEDIDFNNRKKWKELYFPSTEFTLKFTQKVVLSTVDKVLNNSKIVSFIENRNLATLYKGFTRKNVTLETLASILIMKVYLKLYNDDLLSNTSDIKPNFSHYRDRIFRYLHNQLYTMSANSLFIKQTMKNLKDSLHKDQVNRANIEKIAFKQVINII